MILLDVDLLVHTFHEGAPDHRRDREWLERTIAAGATTTAWVTSDRDFSRFPGLRRRHPLADA